MEGEYQEGGAGLHDPLVAVLLRRLFLALFLHFGHVSVCPVILIISVGSFPLASLTHVRWPLSRVLIVLPFSSCTTLRWVL